MNKQEFTLQEITVMQMALITMTEDLTSVSKNVNYPLNPQARKDLNDMLTALKSAKGKIDIAAGMNFVLPPYKEGDEKELLTKES